MGYYETYWSTEGFNPTGCTGPWIEDLLTENVSSGERWLDYGCGDGRTAGTWMAQREVDYHGVDVSRHAVELAAQAGLQASLLEEERTPYPGDHFDGVVCFEVLEHLVWPEPAVAEIRRVLRPGGKAIVTVPNVAYWHQRLELLTGRWDPHGDEDRDRPWRDPHLRFFSARALRDLLADNGFADVRIEGMRGKLLGHTPLGRGGGPTRVTVAAQRRFPSLLGMNLCAIATENPNG